MLTSPIEIADVFPVRKTRKQKQSFRDAVQSYVAALDYPCQIEKGAFGCRNVVIGDPKTARYLVTAHYDTCARMLIPNLITPCNFWPFLLYQLLIGFGIIGIAFAVGLAVALILNAQIGAAVGYLMVWLLLGLMLFGPANPSNVNDNTSGVITLLEIARTMPDNQRHKVCFVLFDLEEAGLIGSAAYRKVHKQETDAQILLNLDCVGDGNHIRLFPTKRLKKDPKKLTSLYKACGYFGRKDILVQEKGFSVYPSDQANFPYGVGICTLNRSKFGLYLGKIHTPKDKTLDETNINILRAAITTYITCDAAQ